MTHPEKLNAVLHILLNNQRAILDRKPIDKRMTFEFICKTVAEVSEKWEVEYLRNILLNDGYIKMGEFGDGEPPVITHPGIKFIQAGGYKQQAEDRELEQQIKRQTLTSLKRSRDAKIISIIAIIVPTIISIYALWISKQQPTIEELRQWKQQLDTTTIQIHQQKNSLDSIGKILNDTSILVRHSK
jgi:hypothetical protein